MKKRNVEIRLLFTKEKEDILRDFKNNKGKFDIVNGIMKALILEENTDGIILLNSMYPKNDYFSLMFEFEAEESEEEIIDHANEITVEPVSNIEDALRATAGVYMNKILPLSRHQSMQMSKHFVNFTPAKSVDSKYTLTFKG